MNKIRTVISGLFYPVTMMGYFIRALERRDDVELFLVGPYSGDWIPWGGGGGMRLPFKYVKTPNIPLPMELAQQPGLAPSFIESRLSWKPDLWLQIDAGWWLQKPDAGVVAHIATDPHVLDYSKQREQCDYFFNMQRSYMKEGDIHLPYAFDPTVHRPLDIQKEYDGCLVGLQYETRTQLVRALRGAGYNIEYSIGAVYDEFNVLYNKSRVALNWSSLLDLNARTFEAMGMGIPLLTNRIPALDEFFEEGQHYEGFSSIPEAVDRFENLIEDDEHFTADYLARTAYEEVIEKHTYDHRIQQILDTVFGG